MPRYRTPTGMHDILPEDFRWRDLIERAVREIAEAYSFSRIETPLLEHEDLFVRGIGSATDIVQKEMYRLRTRGGDRLALRPEGTGPIVRAYLEHGMKSWPQPVRLWYFGPMFRHERPQAGRFREFWQAGFEIVGSDDPVSDAEAVLVTMAFFRELGLKDLRLHVNSIGCRVCRPIYRKVLVGYLRPRQGELCGESRRRLKTNPLRVLDCKEERCARATRDVHEMIDYLCEPCRVHLRVFLEFLEELDIAYLLDARLVRGLDYYSKTIFEVFPAVADGAEQGRAQSAIASGGRYDALFRFFGNKTVGAVGSAVGVERTIEALNGAGLEPPGALPPQVFLVQLGEQAKRKAPALFEELRLAGFRLRASFGRDSIKSQLRIADKVGAPYVLILGQKEIADRSIILRVMGTGAQETVKREALIPTLRDRLRKRGKKRE